MSVCEVDVVGDFTALGVEVPRRREGVNHFAQVLGGSQQTVYVDFKASAWVELFWFCFVFFGGIVGVG